METEQRSILKYIERGLNAEPLYDQMICYAKIRKDKWNTKYKGVSLKESSKGKLKY